MTTIKKPNKEEVEIHNIHGDINYKYFTVESDENYSGYAILIDDKGEKSFIHCVFFNKKGKYEFINTDKLSGKHKIDDLKIKYDIPKVIYDLLIEEELAFAEIIDKILVCPSCEGIPLVRPGCANCGGFNIKPDILVHHYACGCVDLLNQFIIDRTTGALTCHKCHKSGLIVNCDYDVTHGIQRCFDCGWTGNSARLIGSCHSCNTMFLISEAKDIDVMRYTIRK